MTNKGEVKLRIQKQTKPSRLFVTVHAQQSLSLHQLKLAPLLILSHCYQHLRPPLEEKWCAKTKKKGAR